MNNLCSKRERTSKEECIRTITISLKFNILIQARQVRPKMMIMTKKGYGRYKKLPEESKFSSHVRNGEMEQPSIHGLTLWERIKWAQIKAKKEKSKDSNQEITKRKEKL